jgi:hypothetical protein
MGHSVECSSASCHESPVAVNGLRHPPILASHEQPGTQGVNDSLRKCKNIKRYGSIKMVLFMENVCIQHYITQFFII